ncbi:MAG: ABC transporter permease [Deferribacterota bacterium]|nr:ABC transporter permease [Deferribacterota bacterium]
MLTYIIKRLLLMIPLLIGITFICFIVIHLAPGDPTEITNALNPKASELARERFRKMYNLDKPLHIQYYLWLKKFVVFDFGNSFTQDRRPVLEKIIERLPLTIYLNISALIIIFMVAIPLGVFSAYYRDSLFDKITTIFVFIGFAIPSFWLALLCLYYFGVILHILPISGIHSYNFEKLSLLGKLLDIAKHSLLPILLSAFSSLAGVSRYARNSTLEVLSEDYIEAARARGINEGKILFGYAFRNSLLPIITVIGLSIPALIGGSVIFESIFALPGMGQLFYQSVMMRDYPTIMGILVMGSFLTLIGNLIADILYMIVDPRVRTN